MAPEGTTQSVQSAPIITRSIAHLLQICSGSCHFCGCPINAIALRFRDGIQLRSPSLGDTPLLCSTLIGDLVCSPCVGCILLGCN
jgi:hypothetical protein